MASKKVTPKKAAAKKVAKKASPKAPLANAESKLVAPALALSEVRAHIDGIDLQIQGLIADRAKMAQQVGKAKGPLKAAIDYYRPEREAQVLRKVLDRNSGPLADEVLVRLFREIMSACLAQQEPLKVGFLGPEGTFSQQAMFKHFG
ncbi:MAG: chorismate mutase, partial [Arenimonas sp.]